MTTKQLSEMTGLWLAFMAYFMYFFNRKCVTLVFPQLIQEGLTQQQAGTIVSAQAVSTAIVTFAAGILADRLPAKHLTCFGLAVCSAATFLFASNSRSSVRLYTGYWFLNGLGQGFAMPALIKLTRQLSPATSFATNWSVVLISVNCAGVVNPMVTSLLLQSYHWRQVVQISGLLTLLVAVLCASLLPNTSKQWPVSQSAKNNNNTTDTSTGTTTSVWQLIQYPILWSCLLTRFTVSLTRTSVADWSQLYFIQEKHLDVYLTSSFVSFVEIGGIFGKLLAGRLSDCLLNRAIIRQSTSPSGNTAATIIDSNLKLAARIPVTIAMQVGTGLSMYCYCFTIGYQSSWLLTTLIALSIGVCTSGNVVNLTVIASELSPPNRSGLVVSIVNVAAKIGAVFSGLPLSLIAEHYSWMQAFIAIELAVIFGTIVQLVVSRNQSKLKID